MVAQSLRKLYAHEYDEVKEAFCCVVARKLGHFSAATQQEFLLNYTALAESSSTQRRRYAARHAKELVGWIGVAEAGVLKVVEVLTKDKEEANKIFLIDAIIELAKVKPPATLQSYFNIISYQFTWRIRYELISKVEKLAQAMGRENFKSFLGYYVKYINDIEPEIRSIANSKLEEIIPFLEVDDIMNRILPALKAIPQDTQPYVRSKSPSTQTRSPTRCYTSAQSSARRTPSRPSCLSSSASLRTSRSSRSSRPSSRRSTSSAKRSASRRSRSPCCRSSKK